MAVQTCHFDRKRKNTLFSILSLINQFSFCYLCEMGKAINKVLSFLLSLPVLFYMYSISPFLRPACRHVPGCSQYMLDALKIHGPVIGLWMGTGRILRCRPGGTHGYDPVPLFRFRRYSPFSEMFKRRKKENRLKERLTD